jgi:hypothetical protein
VGVAPGTTKREREEQEARSAKWRAENEAKRVALRAEWLARDPSLSDEWLYYLERGYDMGTVRDLFNPKPEKPETEKQRQKRLDKERRDSNRAWEQRTREAKRLDMRGYSAGLEAGDRVGLDQQMDEDKKRRLS